MTAVVPQPAPGANPSMDPLGAPPSFSGRKGASTTLPGRIDLPANPLTAKFAQPSQHQQALPPPHNSSASIPNLLTPPSNIGGESLSPISSGSNSGSQTAANAGVPPYTPTGYWQPSGTGLTPYINSGSGSTPPSWTATSYPPPAKGLFSPSLNSLLRPNPSPPTHHDSAAPHQSYDLGALPPFPTALAPPHSHSMNPPAPNHHMPYPPQSSPGPLPGHSAPLLPPTPGSHYYGSHSSTHSAPGGYPPYSGASPISQSPMAHNAPIPRMSLSPINQAPAYARPYNGQHPQQQGGGYGMPGPIMSNMHSPGGQMQLVGMMPGFHSGHAANLQHLYGHPGAAPPNDRPFKCDQCPQSFNRNHDLKRHKRIHLAVKPFPCGHCEKSFSRKDALKRHILVKGCGKANNDASKAAIDSGDEHDESSDDENSMRS